MLWAGCTAPGQAGGVFDVDAVALLAREVLREQAPALLAEACAWSVGLSDRPYLRRRDGRLGGAGETLGMHAEAGRQLADEHDGRPELGDARPGTFADALAADGRPYADQLDEQVLAPFVLQTCLLACRRARRTRPAAWAELLDELGEDGADLPAVVRAAEWEAPLRVEAELLVGAALAGLPLVEVEAEGLPLSLVRAAEAVARGAAPVVANDPVAPTDDDLAGSLFLARAALAEVGLAEVGPAPRVTHREADALLAALLGQGLEPEQVEQVLPHLPLPPGAFEELDAALAQLRHERP